MLPVFSVWCDPSAINDPELLEEIGLSSNNAAVGVMCNPHLTGARLARVAEHANLLVKYLEVASEGAALMAGRSPADQLTILRAAVNRSPAGAKMLIPHACPEVVLALHREVAGHRLATHRQVATAIEEEVGRGFVTQLTSPGYEEMMTGIGDRRFTSRWVTISRAYRATSADELIDLASRVAELDADAVTVNYLTLALHQFPTVSSHWATHGGLLGATLAAADHRCDGALLTQLFDTWESHRDAAQGAGFGPAKQIIDNLLTNPSMPLARKKDWAHQQYANRIEHALSGNEKFCVYDLDRVIKSLSTQLKVFDGLDLRALNESLTAEKVTEILRYEGRAGLPMLLRLDILDAAKSLGMGRKVVYQTLESVFAASTARALPSVLAAHFVDLLDGEVIPAPDDAEMGEDYETYMLRSYLAQHLACGRVLEVKLPEDEYVPDAVAQWKNFTRATSFNGPGRTATHGYGHLFGDFTTLRHFEILYDYEEIGREQENAARRGEAIEGQRFRDTDPLLERIRAATREASKAKHHREAFADLIPSGLGDL